MKKLASLILAIFVSMTVCSNTARITVKNNTGKKVYLQPEAMDGYTAVDGSESVTEVDTEIPCYYRFVADDVFYPIYVTPGAEISILCTDGGVEIAGDNKAENDFMRANPFVCRAPAGVSNYSDEWIRHNDAVIAELYSMLDNSGLSADFVAIHKLYLQFMYDNQRLGGVRNAMAFGTGNGGKVELADGFYNFLDTVKYVDERILSIPKWFNIMDDAMEELERQNMIEVSNAHYVRLRAARIANGKVRSMYVVELLKKILKKGYFDDFMSHYDEVLPLVTSEEAKRGLPVILKQYTEICEANRNISRGTQMPDFTANDITGKEYHLSDFKGKVLLLDFWFTGCVPCKAEMPYLEKLAEDISGKDVVVISVSLDTGNQLLATWRKMIESKNADCKVLNVNLPGGFKSDFMKTMNIRFVPRIMLIGKDGKIIDTYAKKPSDPKLKQQIEEVTG